MAPIGYKAAIEWIAFNDEPLDCYADNVKGYCSTLAVAAGFGREPEKIAVQVVRARGVKVDKWYDRAQKTYVCQLKDKDNNQVGEAIFVGSRGEVEKVNELSFRGYS